MYTISIASDKPANLPCRYNFMPQKSQWSRLFVEHMAGKLEQLSAAKGKLKVLSGLSLGADQLFFLAALKAKRKGVPITIEACIPCADYSTNWPKKYRLAYERLIELADKVTQVTEENFGDGHYLLKRDTYMIRKSDLVIALYEKKSVNTEISILLAEEYHKHVVFFKPSDIK